MENLSYNSILLAREATRKLEHALFASGISQAILMQKAGEAVARICYSHFPKASRVAVLAGKGNNGGDGQIAGDTLASMGLEVAIFSDHKITDRKNRNNLAGNLDDFIQQANNFDYIIDALFGIGFKGELPENEAKSLTAATDSKAFLVALDILSGTDCDSGGCAKGISADLTITFFSAKLGHKIMPAKEATGKLIVTSLDLSSNFLKKYQDDSLLLNRPYLWQKKLTNPTAKDHKYSQGHASIFTGAMQGASYLAMLGATSAGAGIVSHFGNKTNLTPVTAIDLDVAEPKDLQNKLRQKKVRSIVFGCGGGKNLQKWQKALYDLNLNDNNYQIKQLWDADALSSTESPSMIPDGAVVTPHTGEFAKLFKGTENINDRLLSAQNYVNKFPHILALKGNDTLIATKDNDKIRVLINDNAPVGLGVAGSGDLLAGIISALMLNMEAFEAAAAGVWIHSQSAKLAGSGNPVAVAAKVAKVIKDLLAF